MLIYFLLMYGTFILALSLAIIFAISTCIYVWAGKKRGYKEYIHTSKKCAYWCLICVLLVMSAFDFTASEWTFDPWRYIMIIAIASVVKKFVIDGQLFKKI